MTRTSDRDHGKYRPRAFGGGVLPRARAAGIAQKINIPIASFITRKKQLAITHASLTIIKKLKLWD